MEDLTARRFLVGGEWRSSSQATLVRSPFTGDVVGEIFVPLRADVDDAIASAAVAHAAGPPPRHERSRWLMEAARRADDRVEELVRLLIAEGGKPAKAARLEVARLSSTLRWSAEEAKRLAGDLIPLDTAEAYGDRAGLVTRVPVGPVLGITPFNFPLNLVAHKLGPALASGCPIVIKPASATPLSALTLAEILEEAGVHPGFVSVLPVGGAAIEAAVRDERIAMVSFTGSPTVGWRLKSIPRRARVTLELGGNAAVIVCRDADLAFAMERIAWGGFYQAGQSCISVQRVYVEEEVYEEALERLAAATERLVVGDPADERTDVGPLIDREALDRVAAWVKEAVAQGARIVTGGKRDDPLYFPTVLADVRPTMKVSCEEMFGPVVAVVPFRDFGDVLTEVNDGRFGLQAGIFSGDITRVFTAFRRLEVGGVIANDVPSWRADEMPYGGVRDSGFGREGIRYAMEEMTERRLLVLNGVRW